MSLTDKIRQQMMQRRITPPSQPQPQQQAQPVNQPPMQRPVTTEMAPGGPYPMREAPQMDNAQMQSNDQMARMAMQRKMEANQGITGETAAGNPVMNAQQLKPSSQMDSQKQAIQVQQNQGRQAMAQRQAQASQMAQRRPTWR